MILIRLSINIGCSCLKVKKTRKFVLHNCESFKQEGISLLCNVTAIKLGLVLPSQPQIPVWPAELVLAWTTIIFGVGRARISKGLFIKMGMINSTMDGWHSTKLSIMSNYCLDWSLLICWLWILEVCPTNICEAIMLVTACVLLLLTCGNSKYIWKWHSETIDKSLVVSFSVQKISPFGYFPCLLYYNTLLVMVRRTQCNWLISRIIRKLKYSASLLQSCLFAIQK